MTARTTAQRQAALRERRKKAGLMEVRGIWLEPVLHHLLKLIACNQLMDDFIDFREMLRKRKG